MGGADGVTKGPNPPRSQLVTALRLTRLALSLDVERAVSNFLASVVYSRNSACALALFFLFLPYIRKIKGHPRLHPDHPNT